MSIHATNAHRSIQNGQLYVEGCSCEDLADRFGTPLFVISEAQLRQNVRNFRRIFESRWPEGRVVIMPSIKASPLLAVQRILNSEGAGCDVYGRGEIEVALRSGVAPDLISVNGSIKDRDLVRLAISVGARIVLDSPREMQICEQEAAALGRTARAMFRLKPFMADLADMSDYVPDREIRHLTQIVKYGIPKSELLQMGRQARACRNIDFVGVHVHMGRHSKRTSVWQAWIESTVSLMRELADTLGGWQPRELNLGGGFPSGPDDDTDVAIKGYDGPELNDIADTIVTTLRQSFLRYGFETQGLRLEFEPGRAIHCDTGIHLARVCNIKHEVENIVHNWIEIDTSQCFLGIGGANFAHPKFDMVIAGSADTPKTMAADIVGMTCNLEILYYQVQVPEVQVGDVVVMLNTGSYTETCAQNFNALPRPAVVLVNGGDAALIKRAESVSDVLARDIVPERLCPKNEGVLCHQ